MKHVTSVALIAIFGLIGCQKDETVKAYGAADKVWRLVELDDAPVTYSATLTFPETGQIAGKAPCNSYTGSMTVPYPWFEAGPLAATRMACPDLEAETTFFAALSAMSLSEVLGDTLLLSNDAGRTMVFKADG
ncbi:MAG: META domain-containing protein [Paracoccaceae bacterium]|nr:META domain-containing protein [Paracoccaceae bacterium]